MFGLEPQQLAFFAILLGGVVLLVTERLRNDVVAVLIILALYLTGVLSGEEALAGFSSEPAIVVAAIFVLTAAMHRTGLSELLGAGVGRLAGARYTRVISVLMPSVALLAAFTHHVTMTAVMLPVTLNLSRERNIPPSKLLMPLAFAASLGTSILIIAAPAFLIASAILQTAGRPPLGIFSIAPIGLVLTVVGTLFVLLVGRWLLPARRGADSDVNRFRLDDYFTEVTVLQDSPLTGRTVDEIEGDKRFTFSVVGLVRAGRRIRRPLGERRVAAGDVLLVRTTPEALVAIRSEPGIELHPVSQYGLSNGHAAAPEAAAEKSAPSGEEDADVADRLVQAVVAPSSDLIGRTLGELDFRRRYGAIVLSLWRRQGWLEDEMAQIRLRAGDVLVLQGDDEALARVSADPGILMMVPFQGETRLRSKAPLAGAIMVGTILLAALHVVSVEMAALAGAVAMVLSRCITGAQAYRAIDARVFVFIAGALPLGVAMQSSGAADLVGGWLYAAVGSWSQTWVLFAIFAVVAVITQFMSDSATTALFGPIAVSLAQGLGHAPEPYVITVAMGAVVAFLTPIGHHGNLLIYGPGGYRFGDFVRVGTPLTIVLGVVVAVLAPLVFSGP